MKLNKWHVFLKLNTYDYEVIPIELFDLIIIIVLTESSHLAWLFIGTI